MTKRTKRQILRDNAWKYFSKYIRNRDKKCVTCKNGLAENAGHFWHNVLDFDEMNVNGQCVSCNKWKSGNLAIYSTYLINKYGIKEFKKLDIRHTRDIGADKKPDEYYLDIINKYKNL